MIGSFMILFTLGKYVNRKEVNKSGFREPSHYLDWVATLDPIGPPPEPPP